MSTVSTAKPKPKGQRPHCLHCDKELAPQFTEELPGYALPGQPLFGPKLEKYKKDHPEWRQFTGHYGRYKDDRFCGVSCGYSYAVAHTKARK